jgi:hypothetical protein
MHPNMAKLLGLNTRPVFHAQTWPTPVDIPYVPATPKKEGK